MVNIVRSIWTQGVVLSASLVPMVAAAAQTGVATPPKGAKSGLTKTEVENLGLGGFFGTGDSGDLFTLIANILNAVLLIAGIVALAYLIFGGFKYITAGGNADTAGEGRTAITNAIIGIILIVAALAILSFVKGRLSS